MFLFVIGMIILLAAIGAIVLGIKARKAKFTALGAIVAALGIAVIICSSLSTVPTGHTGILTTFGKKPLPFYSGGSIPIISGFEAILGIKSLLIGFGLQEDAIHSPNESYGLNQFYKGVETIPYFYKYFA